MDKYEVMYYYSAYRDIDDIYEFYFERAVV